MKSKTLAAAVATEQATSGVTVALNFKLEGLAALQFNAVCEAMSKSKTDLAKFILTHSLPDMVEQLDLDVASGRAELTGEAFIEKIIQLVHQPLCDMKAGTQFELKDLIGDNWVQLVGGERNRAGRVFKQLVVEEKAVPSVRFVETRSNNHALYEKFQDR